MSALRVVAVNLALIMVAALAGELLFGHWFGTDGLAMLNIPRSADIAYDVSLPDGGGWHASYQRDSWGLRGSFDSLDKVAIVTLGGSTTDQRLLSTPDTWPQVMAMGLAEKGFVLPVANAGVDGQSSVGHLLALDVWLKTLPNLRPRYVLVYAGINDVVVGAEMSSYDSMAVTRSWRNTIRERSAFYGLWRVVRGMMQAERYSLTHSFQPEPADAWEVAVPSASPPPGLDGYVQRLERLVQSIRDWGGEPVFITQPMRDMKVQNGKVYVRQGMTTVPALHHFNRQTMAVCGRLSVLCLDLAEQLQFAPGDFYDAIHYTPQGSARIGRWLSGQLAGRL